MQFVRRIKNGFLVFLKGMLLQDLKAVISTFLFGAPFYFLIQMPLSMLFGLILQRYEDAELLIWLFSYILTLPVIDYGFEKIGGIDRKIKIK